MNGTKIEGVDEPLYVVEAIPKTKRQEALRKALSR